MPGCFINLLTIEVHISYKLIIQYSSYYFLFICWALKVKVQTHIKRGRLQYKIKKFRANTYLLLRVRHYLTNNLRASVEKYIYLFIKEHYAESPKRRNIKQILEFCFHILSFISA